MNFQGTLFNSVQVDNLTTSRFMNTSLVEIIRMTVDEYENKDGFLELNYSFTANLFGDVIIVSSKKGICYLAFVDDRITALTELKEQFPKAIFVEKTDKFQENAMLIFTEDMSEIKKIQLHLRATDFQLKVWIELLKIPRGVLTTYGDLANQILQPKASRAVGTAIGNNPIAYLIPCHRVIQQSSKLGGYRWGLTRKRAIINYETSHLSI